MKDSDFNFPCVLGLDFLIKSAIRINSGVCTLCTLCGEVEQLVLDNHSPSGRLALFLANLLPTGSESTIHHPECLSVGRGQTSAALPTVFMANSVYWFHRAYQVHHPPHPHHCWVTHLEKSLSRANPQAANNGRRDQEDAGWGDNLAIHLSLGCAGHIGQKKRRKEPVLCRLQVSKQENTSGWVPNATDSQILGVTLWGSYF